MANYVRRNGSKALYVENSRKKRLLWTTLPAASLLVLGGTFSARAQQSTVSKLVFRNAEPYTQSDLEGVAGVHVGQKLSLADMQAAAQRLVDTGCFDSAVLDSKGTPSALTLIFVLKPSAAGDLHQIGFSNFVWFTPEELMGIARKAAPLVNGGLPEGGAVLDGISEALQTALVAKGVPGAHVGHTLVLPSTAEPVSLIEYAVNFPIVTVNTISLEGVSPEMAPAVQAIAATLRGKPYLDGPMYSTAGNLLRPYLDAGYLDAQIEQKTITVAPGKPGIYNADLHGKVSAGSAYRVTAINFSATPVVSEQSFEQGLKLHPGDVASRAQLLASTAPLDSAYHRLGYMDEYVDTGAKRDPATHGVSYTLTVMPGAVYTLHSVTVQGLSPEARAEFDRAWSPKAGDPYDAEYVRKFVTNNTALHALSGYMGGFEAATDPATHQVDLTVKFVPMPSR